MWAYVQPPLPSPCRMELVTVVACCGTVTITSLDPPPASVTVTVYTRFSVADWGTAHTPVLIREAVVVVPLTCAILYDRVPPYTAVEPL